MECGPCGMDDSTLEAPEIKVIKDPGNPTPEEIELHNAGGHTPPRSWCPVCVEARGKEDPHFAKKVKK